MRNIKLLPLFGFVFLTGCVSVKGIDADTQVAVGDGVSVTPQVQWASISLPGEKSLFWTLDGIGLDEMHFYMGIAPGSPLMRVPGKSDAEIGAYAATMLPNDVMDLLASTMEKRGYQAVHASGLTPVNFGSRQGFRFHLAFSSESGLEMEGTALAIQQDGRLDLILFIAPTEYYFSHCQPIVDKVFASVQIG